MLTFLFGDGVIQKGNFNLSFFKKFGLECCIVDDTNLEQFVPLTVNGPYFTAPLFCIFFAKLNAELKLTPPKTEAYKAPSP